MPVIIRTKSGAEHVLDRRYTMHDVRLRVQDGREGRFGVMIALDDNRMPGSVFYVDPHEIESIRAVDDRNCPICGVPDGAPHKSTCGPSYRNKHGHLVADELHNFHARLANDG